MAPPVLAAEGDPIGLQVGEPTARVRKILVCLSLTENIALKAAARKIDLIIAHHPLIFEPLNKIDFTTPTGLILKILIQKKISFFNAHTNLDATCWGVADELARAMGLNSQKTAVLEPLYREKLLKLVVFVPKDYTEEIIRALSSAGAGWLGNYDSCTFSTPGVGTFRPLKGTRPFIGKIGRLSHVNEDRVETIVSEFNLNEVLGAMWRVHPYEEVAYDLYPLASFGRIFGQGRIGTLPDLRSTENFLKSLRKKFKSFRVDKPLKQKRLLRKVAVAPGSGGRLVEVAARKGADLFITGEIKYHQLQEALGRGLTVVSLGHEESEQIIVPVVGRYLKEKTNLSIITQI